MTEEELKKLFKVLKRSKLSKAAKRRIWKNIQLSIKKKNMDWSFLKANRFWAMVIGAVSIYLKAKGWIGEPEMVLIATLTAGFVTVRTVDRAMESLKE